MTISRRTMLHFPAALALGGLAAGAREADASATGTDAPGDLPRGEFHVDVDDIRMFCEVRGQGPLLIHQTGVWTMSATSVMAPMNEALSRSFTVLTMDARGQGRTTLGEGPTSYTRVAADTVRLMDKLSIDKAHFFGVSDGGCIQLELLLNFEERVTSSTLSGTPYSHDSYRPEVRATFEKWHEEMLADSDTFYGLTGQPQSAEEIAATRKIYESVSPHPELFLKVMKEQRRCWATEPDVSPRRLSAIKRPVLVINAGADEYIPKSEFDALENAIPGARSVFFADMKHLMFTHATQITDAVAEFTRRVDTKS